MFTLLALFATLAVCFYAYVKHCHSYWSKRGIPTLPPKFFVGNIADALTGRSNFMVPITEAYKKFRDYKYIGFYQCLSPTLIVTDPELIGNIVVKDFTHFCDNAVAIDEKADYLSSRNAFVLKGDHWKTMKFLMTPMFTSGKMKLIFPLMDETGHKVVAYLRKQIAAGTSHCMDAKRLAHQFTTENVANCAFGLQAEAFQKDSEFVRAARQFGTPNAWQALKLGLMFMMPSLGQFLSIGFFPKWVQDYLFNIVQQTMKYRKDSNLVRNDFLDMISQLKEKSVDYPFSDEDVAAQAASFFGDGIETSSVVITYCLYELAANPDTQEVLRDEINDVLSRYDNKVTYDAINEMTYLECIINETLRLDAPLMALFKTCTKTYTFPPPKPGVPGHTVHPGDTILIPVEGLHRDEEYFPNAEEFVPERFTKENKANIKNYSYLPFGEGPRFCLGMRFGVLQVKVALAHIIHNFKVGVNGKMIRPLQLDPTTVLRMPTGGFWLDFDQIPTK